MRGLNNVVKRWRMLTHVMKIKPDIIFVQETHLRDSKYPIFNSQWYTGQYAAPGISKTRGVAILITKSIHFVLKDSLIDPQGRYIFVKGHLDATDSGFSICSQLSTDSIFGCYI